MLSNQVSARVVPSSVLKEESEVEVGREEGGGRYFLSPMSWRRAARVIRVRESGRARGG